jgi:site-specific DNA recombinase
MEVYSKKAIAYVRISSTRQIDNESPETQKLTIQKYADANNIEILEWFYDEAKSGKNTEREELKNLLLYASKYQNKIDYVVVYKMNRMSRDLDSYVMNVRIVLKKIGITIRSATEQVDDTVSGRFMENMLIMLGQMDNEVKSSTTIDNMRSLALQGYWQHPPVIGYEPDKIQNDLGKPRPTLRLADESEKVRMVLVRFSQGDITKAELTRFAKEIGLRSRYDKFLGEDSINRMLKNSVYAGYVSDKFTEYKNVQGRHPAIISKEIYERNQKILYGKNTRLGEKHITMNSNYPLRGLLLCMNCQKPLYSSAPKSGGGKQSPRYHCARTTCVGKVPSVKSETVHDEFVAMLERIKPSDEILKLYRHVLVKEANHALDDLNSKVSSTRKKLDKLSELRSSAINKLIEGTITKDEKDVFIDDLDRRKTELTDDLYRMENQQSVRETDINTAIDVMENVHKQWQVSEFDIQIRFQCMLFPRGVVYDSVNHRFGTSEISELYRYVSTKKDLPEPEKSFLVAGPGLEPGTSWL